MAEKWDYQVVPINDSLDRLDEVLRDLGNTDSTSSASYRSPTRLPKLRTPPRHAADLQEADRRLTHARFPATAAALVQRIHSPRRPRLTESLPSPVCRSSAKARHRHECALRNPR